jgi:hypothetical protein
MRNWKAFAGSVWAQLGAPSERDLDRLLGRRHKVAPRTAMLAAPQVDQHLSASPVQEPARI